MIASRLAALILIVLSGLLAGCRSQQLVDDQSSIRKSLLGLYQDQILDNLILARNNLPYVHIDYSNFSGTIEQTATGSVGTDFTRKHTDPQSTVAAAVERTGKTAYGLGGSQKSQLTMKGDPIINNNAIYDMYLTYAKDDSFLKTLDNEPLSTECHVKRFYNGKWYFVPKSASSKYLNLFLATTVRREVRPSPAQFNEVTVVGFEPDSVRDEKNGTGRSFVLIMDTAVPNDAGIIEVSPEGASIRFKYGSVPELVIGQATQRIRVFVGNEIDIPGLMKQIVTKKARVTGSPGPKATLAPLFDPKALEDLKNQLELNRLQDFGRD